jgi:hypothetical protein
MYPHERSLVQRLAGRPFALVGVNSDKNLEELHAAMAKEQITWPSWFDGGGTGGPIASLYEVRSWPTIFVLDPRGVIRFKDVRGEALDKAVDGLLEEFGLNDVMIPAQVEKRRAKPTLRREASGKRQKNDTQPAGNTGSPK